MSENTDDKQRPAHLWRPGQSGNPSGRPQGARSKLGYAFVEALQADFSDHGAATIKKVREEKPDQYLKVIASILPQEVHVKDTTLEDMSDDELIGVIAALRSAARSGQSGATTLEAPGPGETAH